MIAQNVADPEKRGCTIVRILAHLWLTATTPGAVSGIQRVHCGIGLASDDAFSANALPDIDQDSDFPVGGWMWRDLYVIKDETLASGVFAPIEIKVDLRAQRKMDRASVFLARSNTANEGSAFSVRMTGLVRVLYKLP